MHFGNTRQKLAMCNTVTFLDCRLRGANDDSAGIHPFLAA